MGESDKAWGEVRNGKDGALHIFTPRFNAVLAHFTEGAAGDLSEGTMLYTSAPALRAEVEALKLALRQVCDMVSDELTSDDVPDLERIRNHAQAALAGAQQGGSQV